MEGWLGSRRRMAQGSAVSQRFEVIFLTIASPGDRSGGYFRARRGRRVSGRFGVGADLQPPHHEIHQRFPVGKKQVARERAHIIEEGLAGGQGGADQPVVGIGEGQKGVKEKGQDIHRGQQRGQMLFTVPKVVLQMKAASWQWMRL